MDRKEYSIPATIVILLVALAIWGQTEHSAAATIGLFMSGWLAGIGHNYWSRD